VEVAPATGAPGLFLGFGQCGKKQGGQDANDSDNYQQLNQRKSTAQAEAFPLAADAARLGRHHIVRAC